jgi:hypothetical protein
MEISNTLLAAMMFVMILSMGIMNIIAWLAGIADQRSENKISWILISWLVLLLIAQLNMFWHTLDILSIEDLKFGGFLYIIVGPILVFFATSVMLPGASQDESNGMRGHYFGVSRRFFAILALLQVWDIGVDTVLGKGFSVADIFSVAILALALALTSSQHARLHTIGTAVAWLIFLAALSLRGFGVTV